MTHSISEWLNCYPSNWKGVIVPDAMAHPAKYSSRLIRRIYEHMIEMGWLKPGDKVIDPFGGVALGALDAMRLGLDWTGIELEEKFHTLGNQNINKWCIEFTRMRRWGSARLLHGDSRKLMEMIQIQASAAVSSPPFEDSLSLDRPSAAERREHARELGISNAEHVSPIDMEKIGKRHEGDYGTTPGQLGNMRGNFNAAISSPPFLQSEGGTGEKAIPKGMDAALMTRHAAGNKSANGYGSSNGQLSSMKDGGFDAAISSPPYNESEQNYRDGWERFHKGHTPKWTKDIQREAEYGTTEGQLSQANDFWLSARAIVEQVYTALEPGGHAVWVVKDYVKNKQIVPFSDQWRQLCEAVGFETLHEHHAMLVHHKGSQHTLDGGMIERKTESKSFFRRLAEKKGSPRIDYEVVYCMEK